ncbi:MAG: ABC transporter substrate-binding protein [Chloroflexota bacterium]|nr:ABC transporter substrate-binding protein [Chloroflexota bacterium]
MRIHLLHILVLIAMLLAFTGCGMASSSSRSPSGATHHATRVRLQRASLVLDWYPNSDHGGLYIAMQRGMFRRQGIAMSVHVPSDTSAQIELVGSGHADFGISYETDLLAARAHRIPVQSVMCIMQHPLDTVMALRSSGITRPRDLAGKTIGMAGAPSDSSMVKAMMADDGSSISRSRLVTVGYSLSKVLLTKRVDAVVGVYWTWEAIQARMLGYPVNVLRVERWGVPNYCELVLVANERTIRTRPAYVRNVVQAMQQGYAYAEAHPQSAWLALHAQDKTLDRGLVLRSLQLLRPIVTTAPTIGYQSLAQWRHYARWLAANHLIDEPVDASRAFTNRFLAPGVT